MAQPGRYVLVVYRGDTTRWQFNLWADAAKSVAADLTGATVTAQIRTRPGGTLVVQIPCTVTLPNSVLVTLSAAASGALGTGSAAWDMQVVYPSGDVSTVLQGPVNVTADVTLIGAS